jgi:hypothetical protein
LTFLAGSHYAMQRTSYSKDNLHIKKLLNISSTKQVWQRIFFGAILYFLHDAIIIKEWCEICLHQHRLTLLALYYDKIAPALCHSELDIFSCIL